MSIAAREIHLKSRPTGLPGQDNFQLVERNLPAPAEGQLLVKTLFMSGYTENAIIHHGRLDEGVVLLSKPFPRSQLAVKLREVLDSRQ